MKGLERFKRHLKPGEVYRREDLLEFSKSADRYLRELVEADEVQKLWKGVYCRRKTSTFGLVPAANRKVVEAFLRDDDFYATSLNHYNSLRLGTTQLYRHWLVYNHKRDGRYVLDNQHYYFIKGRKFPRRPTMEFMLVDVINNLKMLAEDTKAVRFRVLQRATALGIENVVQAANRYGTARTKALFNRLQKEGLPNHA